MTGGQTAKADEESERAKVETLRSPEVNRSTDVAEEVDGASGYPLVNSEQQFTP